MMIVMANDLPPAVRGRMKLWFIEARPNVFVSGIKDHLAEKILTYLCKYCPIESGLIIFKQIKESPGYRIHAIGSPAKNLSELSGFQVIVEKLNTEV